ncbi:MAG: glycosyltransferase family 61 protein [Proteobacteria bacterium]|nr:glycosyltransferase family 61 protein [Pseudomonadota bacterium]
MNSPTRIVHDCYDGVVRAFAGRPRAVDRAPVANRGAEWTVQTPGSFRLANALESAFYGRERTPLDYTWPEARMDELRDVLVVGDQGQVFFPDGAFYTPCIYPHQSRLEKMRIRRPVPWLARREGGTLFHLTGRNHENKGHFLLQHVSRLLVARPVLEQFGDYRILVAPGHARWQKNFLRLIGIDESRVVEGTQGTLQAERLLHAPLAYGSNALSPPDHYLYIRDRAAEVERQQPPGPARPIFVTRRDAPDKRVVNEDALIAVARELLGELDVFEFKGKTLADQIVAFRRAPVILGPIGQGICNVLFSEGSLLVTLAPGTPEKEVYASSHGTQLALICGNQAVTLYNGETGESRGNWSFPVEAFRAQLTRLLTLPELAAVRQRLTPA